MGLVLTEQRIKAIIEENVRKCLYEYFGEASEEGGGEDSEDSGANDDSNILSALRTSNMADVAQALISNGIWADLDIDTARSEISKISRGLLPLTPELAEIIKRELQRTAAKMKV